MRGPDRRAEVHGEVLQLPRVRPTAAVAKVMDDLAEQAVCALRLVCEQPHREHVDACPCGAVHARGVLGEGKEDLLEMAELVNVREDLTKDVKVELGDRHGGGRLL